MDIRKIIKYIKDNLKFVICLSIFIIILALAFWHENFDTGKPRKTEKYFSEEITETTTETPLVSYSDVKKGLYNYKRIRVEGVVTNIKIDKILSLIEANVWIKDGNEYINDGEYNIYESEVGTNKYNYLLQNLKIGDNCIFSTQGDENYISTIHISDVKITGNTTDLAEIKQTYINGCQNVNINDFIRNPENYKDTDLKISGSIYQVVDENAGNVELLLDTGAENGLLYIRYELPENSNRILEGDNVTVYGHYEFIKSYYSVLGTNKNVPELKAEFIL